MIFSAPAFIDVILRGIHHAVIAQRKPDIWLSHHPNLQENRRLEYVGIGDKPQIHVKRL